MTIQAYAASESSGQLIPYEYTLDVLGPDEVDILIKYCGICHSDLSMLDNHWRITQFPFVPGHEIIGEVINVGSQVNHLHKGQNVGVGWIAGSCQCCDDCLSGNNNLCSKSTNTIVGRHGGFADKIRVRVPWVIPLPDGINLKTAGPLLCGGITVFNPLVQNNISPLSSVGVIGIGGLGHMALKFLKAWGCEVTAFSTSPDKKQEALDMGAHHFVSTHSDDDLKKLKNRFDLIINTVNVELNWDAYIKTLKSKGIFHIVGVANKVEARIGNLMGRQRSISASPTGSPYYISEMLKFASRHNIEPMVEVFAMSDVNKAIEHLRNGKPRYRIVLEN